MLSTLTLPRYRYISLLATLALFLSVLFTGSIQHVQAGNTPAPLILVIDGDLWSWTGPDKSLKQLTNWGYNSDPVISPDGQYVAYLSTAAVRVNEYKKGNTAFADDGPQNIWVFDLTTGANTRVADQPAGASDLTNPRGYYVTRWAPVWSPDGSQLAWTDLTCCTKPAPDGSTGRWEALVVYDWQQKSARTTVKQLPKGKIPGGRNPSALDWGAGGIVFHITPPPDDAYLYSLDGKQLARIDLSDCPNCGDIHWIKTGNSPLLMLASGTLPYLLIDPSTGQDVVDSGVLVRVEQYSLTAPDGMALYQNGAAWFTQMPGQAPINLGQVASYLPAWISLAPDGKQAVFVSSDAKLYIVSDGKISEVTVGQGKGVAGVAWSTMGWRLKKL